MNVRPVLRELKLQAQLYISRLNEKRKANLVAMGMLPRLEPGDLCPPGFKLVNPSLISRELVSFPINQEGI